MHWTSMHFTAFAMFATALAMTDPAPLAPRDATATARNTAPYAPKAMILAQTGCSSRSTCR